MVLTGSDKDTVRVLHGLHIQGWRLFSMYSALFNVRILLIKH